MNIDILHRPTALENLLAGRIWPAGRRLPMHALNQLNKKLQGPGTNIIVHSDAINAFVVKLNLWRQRAKNNNFASFHRLTEITGDDFNKNLKED